MSLPAHTALLDRAQAAFLGLALGDAYGRTLEFVLLPEVRRAPVAIRSGAFQWTDDTHMSLFLAKALLDQPVGPVDEDRLGRAVGARFAEWANDPLTPSTAPGNTCLRGARAFIRHGDWQRSGDRASDGCGAVMRVAPVALGYDGADLVQAARISSIVTHAHPNAVEAAIAGAWLCRQAVLRGRFDEGLVGAAIAHLRGDWAWGGEVVESLEAALQVARGPTDGWLEEESIPPGDGGWRSGSALGLAVAAALRWGPAGFAAVVEKAARIEGDSDSVAALAGMFHGAAHGSRSLPAAWLEHLPERETIRALSTRLWGRFAPLEEAPTTPGAVEAERPTAVDLRDRERSVVEVEVEPEPDGPIQPTWDDLLASAPSPAPVPAGIEPLRVAWLDLKEVGPRAPRGRIGFARAPGQGAIPDRRRILGSDLDRLVALHEVDHIVLLLDPAEQSALGIAELGIEAEARRMVVFTCPIPPGARPNAAALDEAVRFSLAVARAGRRVVMISRDGQERAGVMASACLVAMGQPAEAALRASRALLGPRAASSDPQRAFVLALSPSPQAPAR